MDVIQSKNRAYLEAIREIENLYEKASADEWSFYAPSVKEFDKAIDAMPQRVWVE